MSIVLSEGPSEVLARVEAHMVEEGYRVAGGLNVQQSETTREYLVSKGCGNILAGILTVSFWWFVAGMNHSVSVTAVPNNGGTRLVVQGSKKRLLEDFSHWLVSEFSPPGAENLRVSIELRRDAYVLDWV